MATEIHKYDSWGNGEFGTLPAWKAPNGSWTGKNVVVYRDGFIGPRPGLRKVPLLWPEETGPTGWVLQGLGHFEAPGVDAPTHWLIIGDQMFSFTPFDDGFIHNVGPALDDPVPAGVFVRGKESTRNIDGKVYFTVLDGTTYTYEPETFTITKIPGDPIGDAPGGVDIEVYRDRMVVGRTGPYNRYSFSGQADFTSWPVANYTDTGLDGIVALAEYRGQLVVFTGGGQWLVTGTLGVNEVLRRVSDALPPLENTVNRTNDELVYIPASRSAPVVYNGSYGDEQSLKHLEYWKLSEGCHGAISYGNRDILFLSEEGRLLWRKNGAWSKHEFEIPVGPAITRWYDDHILVAYLGEDGETLPEFYTMSMVLDRPAFYGDATSQPGDDSNTPINAEFTLPDWYAPSDTDVFIRRVIVDFVAYDIDTTETVHFKVEPTIIARSPGGVADVALATQEFSESPASFSEAGVPIRKVFNFAATQGGGYRLALTELRGVKIRSISVEVSTSADRPRA